MVANLSKPQLLFLLKYKNFEKKTCLLMEKQLNYHIQLNYRRTARMFFGGRGSFLQQGHFGKRFMYKIQKKGSAGKYLGVFFLKLHFKREFNPQMYTNRALFAEINQGTFFPFSKQGRGDLPSLPSPPSCVPELLGIQMNPR